VEHPSVEEVATEINRITAERFQEADRLLVILYQKALTKLDQHLDSPNVKIQARAIDRVLKFYEPKDKRGRPLIAQFFAGAQGQQGGREKSFDEIILENRKQRGLPND
jgi:hypothetical protein